MKANIIVHLVALFILLLFSFSIFKNPIHNEPGANKVKTNVKANKLNQTKKSATEKRTEFRKLFADLSVHEVASGNEAIHRAIQYAKSNGTLTDPMFTTFIDWMNQVADTQTGDEATLDSKTLIGSGFRASFSEGGYWLILDGNELKRDLSPYISKGASALLELLNQPQIFSDGAIIVPYDQLVSEIIENENFLDKYPGLFEVSLQHQLNNYLTAYVKGTDNTRVYVDGRIAPELKLSYEKFLSEHADSKYYELVKKVYEKWSGNGFRYTGDVGEYLNGLKIGNQ